MAVAETAAGAAGASSLMPWALAGNAVAQLGGNLIGGYHADKAAERQAKSAQEALNFKKMVYDKATQQLIPYQEAAQRGLVGYEGAVTGYTKPTFGYTQKDFNLDLSLDPGYKYRLDQAKKAIEASTTSKGMGLSSGMLKSLQTRSQDMASQEYNNAYDRWMKESNMRYGQASDQYGRDINFANQNLQNYKGLSDYGPQATAAAVGASQGVGEAYSDIGAAGAMGDASKANMWQSSANVLGKGLSDYLLEQEKIAASKK